jgi:mRNA interferase RelE/StbE
MNLTFTDRALKDLKMLDSTRQSQILDVLAAFENDPSSARLQKLKGFDTQYRIRVGSYRIRLEIHWTLGSAEVRRIQDRKDAYRGI